VTTATTPVPDAAPDRGSTVAPEHGGTSLASATFVLGRRALVSTARQPATWVPGLAFPLLIAAVNSASLGRTTGLPGFPDVDSFLQFLLPATLIQGVTFGGIIGGADMAVDIQGGFFDRLLSSPVPRTAILVGRLVGSMVLGLVQAVVFMGVFMLFGVRIAGGAPAMLTLMVMGMLLALAIGGFAAGVGLRTGSQEAVQNFFPLVFVALFISSAFFPTALMNGWFRWAAEHNPVSWLINGARDLVITGFSWSDAGAALGIAAVLAAITISFAGAQLRRRLKAS
jgi:ABC-2 type transport system permease protein